MAHGNRSIARSSLAPKRLSAFAFVSRIFIAFALATFASIAIERCEAAHVRAARRGAFARDVASARDASDRLASRSRTSATTKAMRELVGKGFGARRGHGDDHLGQRDAWRGEAATRARASERRRARVDEEATRREMVDAIEREGEDDAMKATIERWRTLDDVEDEMTCDGCKLTARAVFADAVASARTTRASSWKALDRDIRESVMRLVWRTTTCKRVVNVTAVRRDGNGRLVDARGDTRDSEISNPGEARVAPENVTDTVAIAMLEKMCVLLREDAQASDWLVSTLTGIDEVRSLTEAQARFACDILAKDEACTVRERVEL